MKSCGKPIRFLSSLAVGRKFELVSVITPEALPILGDRIQLQQVILNLVMNGIDAMKDTPSENRIISIRTSRVENFAQLSVSDRGSGIPEDKLNAVFEPFFTSKAEGMGMGLSIARTIIEAHNGSDIGKKSGSRRCVVSDQASALYRRRWIGRGRLGALTISLGALSSGRWPRNGRRLATSTNWPAAASAGDPCRRGRSPPAMAASCALQRQAGFWTRVFGMEACFDVTRPGA